MEIKKLQVQMELGNLHSNKLILKINQQLK